MWRLLSPVIFDHCSPFFMPDNGNGSGGNNDGEDEEDDLEDPPSPTATGNAIADQVLRDYFDRNRNWVKAQRRTLAKNRRAAAEARQTLANERAIIAKKVVIEPADQQLLETYKQLGTPDDIKTKIASGETAAQEALSYKRNETLRSAADVSGYNFDVLKDRVGTQEVLVREVEQDGQKIPQAFIKGENNQEIPLVKFAEDNWSVYLPALVADAGENGRQYQPREVQQQFPGQGSARSVQTRDRKAVQVATTYVGAVYKGPPKRG